VVQCIGMERDVVAMAVGEAGGVILAVGAELGVLGMLLQIKYNSQGNVSGVS